MRKLFDRNVELVAYIAPERTQHFVVELRRTIVVHQLRGFLQSLGRYLIGLTSTLADDIGIIDSTLTEDNEQRDKDERKHGK